MLGQERLYSTRLLETKLLPERDGYRRQEPSADAARLGTSLEEDHDKCWKHVAPVNLGLHIVSCSIQEKDT